MAETNNEPSDIDFGSIDDVLEAGEGSKSTRNKKKQINKKFNNFVKNETGKTTKLILEEIEKSNWIEVGTLENLLIKYFHQYRVKSKEPGKTLDLPMANTVNNVFRYVYYENST